MIFDVAIVGGGPAGTVAGLVLAAAGYDCCIIERQEPAFRIGEVLPSAARPLLWDLGVLDAFLAEGHMPCYGNLSLWGASSPYQQDFLFDPNGCAWHLDRRRFNSLLCKLARQRGIAFYQDFSCQNVAGDGNQHVLRLTNEYGDTEVQCKFVIDATGRLAAVGRQLGAVRKRDDRLMSINAIFDADPAANAQDQFAYTIAESVPEGWWYSARLPHGRQIAAFQTDADLVRSLGVQRPHGFLKALGRTSLIRGVIGSRQMLDGTLRMVPAESSRLHPASGPNWLAVGDAACAFDPLSSQGLFHAIFTGMTGGQAVYQWFDGNRSLLDRYGHTVASIYAAYQENLKRWYRAEPRWRKRSFGAGDTH